jgi:ribosome-binding factor A
MKEYPRSVRVGVQVQAELSSILRSGLLHDPRVHDIDLTITAVEVARDLGAATVRVSSLKSDEQLTAAVSALNHAAGRLRHELGLRLRMRYIPSLRFIPDTALREGDRIGTLIRRATDEDRRVAEQRGDGDGVGKD